MVPSILFEPVVLKKFERKIDKNCVNVLIDYKNFPSEVSICSVVESGIDLILELYGTVMLDCKIVLIS